MNVMMKPMHKETTKVTLNGGENGDHGIHGEVTAEDIEGIVGLGDGGGGPGAGAGGFNGIGVTDN